MGVVLATSKASGGMGSDVRGQGGAMGVSLVDSSDVRGLGGGIWMWFWWPAVGQ